MSDPVTTPAPQKRRTWLRLLAWVFGVLFVLIIAVYFVATSAAFLKGVILPKVSAAMNAQVTVSDASISPFKQVVLKDLKVQTTGTEPLVSAPEVRLRYSLMDIMRGTITVEEVTLTSPTISLVENPDGSSNLDPITQSQQKKETKPQEQKPAQQPSKPAQLDIKKVALTDATVRKTKLYAGGTRDVMELSHINVNLDDLKNGGNGKLTLGADVAINKNPPAPEPKAVLEAKVAGNFSFALTPALKPALVQGNTRVTVSRADGALAQAAAFAANLDCDITATDVKQVTLAFRKGETPLGQLRVSGPFNMEKTEGKLGIELAGIDKRLLNIVGAANGLDFGPTTINLTNQLQIAKAGGLLAAAGRLNLNQLQVTRTNVTTPPFDLHADYDVTVDTAANKAELRVFTINGTQKGNQVIRGELSNPMVINWADTNNPVGDSSLKLAVTHLSLADWKPFLGQVAPAGDVNANLQVVSQAKEKTINFDADSALNDLVVMSDTNAITGLKVTLKAQGQGVELKAFKFPSYRLEVSRQDQPMVALGGSGTYNRADETADLQLEGQLTFPAIAGAVPQYGMNFSSGVATLKAHVTQQAKNQNVTGTFVLANLTGNLGSNVFNAYGTTADFELAMTPEQAELKKLSGKLVSGDKPGGTYDLSGTFGLSNKVTVANARLQNWNENALGPFLAPLLTGKKLVSVALNGTTAVNYDQKTTSTVKASVAITNLVVTDPKIETGGSPLEAKMALDLAIANKVLNLRECRLSLTPTDRATNALDVTGQVDTSKTNTLSGNLKILADALDFTRYYDIFAGGKTETAKPGTPAPTAPAPSTPAPAAKTPEKKTEPTQMHFVAEALLKRVYLHEVEITNFQTTVKLEGQKMDLNPFKLTLNGAPVSSTVALDLGVPAMKYDVALDAQAIPLAPLVNSFQPDRKGQIGGTLTASAKLTGAGTEGADLQTNLVGQFYVGSTNLNLAVSNIRSPLLRALVNVVSSIPDLVKNPTSALGSVLGSLTQKAGAATTGGLAGDLQKSPIDKIVLQGQIGSNNVPNGVLALQQAMVQSPAFQADAAGTVAIAPVLTNSAVNIPVIVSLTRGVAEKINMVPANTPTNATYVKLPEFLTMKGTVGKPETVLNKVALATIAVQGVGANMGGQSGSVLQGIGNLLQRGGSGGAKATNAPPASSTNKAGGGLLQQFQGLLQPATGSTNAPAPGTNAPTTSGATSNQTPVGNLLNNLFGPKK